MRRRGDPTLAKAEFCGASGKGKKGRIGEYQGKNKIAIAGDKKNGEVRGKQRKKHQFFERHLGALRCASASMMTRTRENHFWKKNRKLASFWRHKILQRKLQPRSIDEGPGSG